MDHGDQTPSTLVLDPSQVTDELASAKPGRNVLAILASESSSQWRRTWQREVGWEPAQTGIVETYELVRSAATTQGPKTAVVEEDLALTRLPRSLLDEQLLDTTRQYLEGWDGGQASTLVYLDSLGKVCAEVGEAFSSVLSELLGQADAVGATVYASLDSESVEPSTVVTASEAFERVVGAPLVDPDVLADVQRLRADDPTNFGYARRHWREAMAGLEAVDRTYPKAKQVHAALDEPETTPRTLGAALKAMETLGVVDLWGDTVGPNRYDLRSYDADRLAAVGFALDQLD